MSKCGKGCMPECEYFTTGGCISPFNCMYKEESGYINSATSGKVFYTGELGVSNALIDDPASIYEVVNALQAEVEKLKAENAELKEKDIHCANSMDDMIKRCDSCGLSECIGCEHSHAAVMEVKKLKEDYESLKGRLSNENV